MLKEDKIPLVAFIGLPNSGKTTLLNRLTGKRAVTALEAHTTRDLNYGEDYWEGMFMRFVDTGGLVPDPQDKIQKEVQLKSWAAIARSDLLVLITDRKRDPESISQSIIQKIWKTGKPFIIAVNKVDDPNLDSSIADYAFLGGNGFVNISCNTGYGLNNLMDIILENLVILGFKQSFEREYNYSLKQETKKQQKLKTVKKAKDGGYFVVRNEEGSFESNQKEEIYTQLGVETKKDEDFLKEAKIKNLVFDLRGVVLELRHKVMTEHLVKNYKFKTKEINWQEIWDNPSKNHSKFESLEFWESLVKKLGMH